MNDIRRERLILFVASFAFLACTLQNYISGWEFWVPPVAFGVGVGLWIVHLTQRGTMAVRTWMYFAYAAFLVFYHGIHETSFYDVAVAIMLFMATFTTLNNVLMLKIIIVEYLIIMAIQFMFILIGNESKLDAYTTVKIIFHIGSVMTLYFFMRLTVNRRIGEKEKIREWREAVKENESDMEDFLANISHEFRTPVNVISGMTALLKKNEEREELDSISEATHRLSNHIEDIQDYTEIKRGELVLEEEEYMCDSLINDVISAYRNSSKRNNLELVVDLSPKTPSILRGDIQKIHKLFRHLLSNALKFTKRGGVYIKVFPIKQEYGINLIIEVTDTGIGMTRADIAKVSNGMYQANKKRNRSTQGIGLGLPIVYGFVHKMGGFVKIDSTKGSGTKVRVSIPQKVVNRTACLTINPGHNGEIVFYTKPEKYKVPELREFNRSMAVNLATGLGIRLFSASEPRELDRLMKEINITHIFTGQEEYEAERELFDSFAGDGYKVIVSADVDFHVTQGSNVLMMPKPLYAFPVVRIINGDYGDFEAENATGRIRFNGVKALVVDDEPMNLIVASGLLREYKMETDTADSGKEAIEKYRTGDYDVIFMDHMMPEMDGVEAMKHIREAAKQSDRNPVMVALTANALSGAREMFIREGFDGFIAKPIDIGEFERVMKNVLPDEMIQRGGRDES